MVKKMDGYLLATLCRCHDNLKLEPAGRIKTYTTYTIPTLKDPHRQGPSEYISLFRGPEEFKKDDYSEESFSFWNNFPGRAQKIWCQPWENSENKKRDIFKTEVLQVLHAKCTMNMSD